MTDETHFTGTSWHATQAEHTFFTDVGEFHRKMGLPITDGFEETRQLSAAEFDYRLKFMQEELQEFVTSYARGDVAGMADALADLTYVALGTAHYMRLPFDEVWDEVQRSNMEKRRWREGDPVKPRAVGVPGLDVIKPPGWRGPDVAGVIKRFCGRVAERMRR